MERLEFNEILKAVKGKVVVDKEVAYCSNVSTDTRNIKPNSIFIALKGERFNGNEYIKEASLKGALICIVDEIKYEEEELSGKTSIIIVEDTKKALLDLAKFYRSKLNLKVIGITGSTGKTSTKDLVAAALSSKFKVFKTKGNFNNEIGLPLMVFSLDNTYDIAVLEMGMSNLDEIHKLADVARPNIALITNVGLSHIENLKTRENILKAKLEITDFFSKENTLIINGDNDLLVDYESNNFNIIKVSVEKVLDYSAKEIVLNDNGVEFKVLDANGELSSKFSLPVPGKHNVSNSLLAIACGRKLGLNYAEMMDGLNNIEITSMRLDIVKGEKYTIIDDCYNASPDSMKAAIDVLSSLKGNNKIAVLGTMKELGDEAYNAHRDIGLYAKEKGINLLVAIGEFSDAYKVGFDNSIAFREFSNYDDVITFISSYIKYNDIVLVKASRSMKFENIVKNLKIKNC